MICYSIASSWDTDVIHADYKITCHLRVHVCLNCCVYRCVGLMSALSRPQFLSDFDETWHWHRRLETETKEPFRWGSKSNKHISYFYFFYPQIDTSIMHFQRECRNTSLKSQPCWPIKTVYHRGPRHSSNDVSWRPPTPECRKKPVKQSNSLLLSLNPYSYCEANFLARHSIRPILCYSL